MPTFAKDQTISVVIPLYNHENYIDAAIDSVLNQTIAAKQIIVIDDGSSDNSLQRAQRRAAQDFRILVVSHPNQGAHYTINAGIQLATSDFVSILNSDDTYHPERFSACLASLAANPQADAVCTALSFCDGKGKPRTNGWYEQALDFYHKTGDLSQSLINGNFFMTTSNLFIRRQVFDKIGLFASLRYAHDLDFFLRMNRCKRQILWLNTPLLSYRMHDTNTINEGHLKVKIEWAAVVAYFLFCSAQHQTWDVIEQILKITDSHELTRLILLFFIQYQHRPETASDVGACFNDSAFVQFFSKTVR